MSNEQEFKDMMEAAQEIADIESGRKKPRKVRAYPDLDVKAIRAAVALHYNEDVTQDTFALILGVPQKTIANWEQCRNKPTGAARMLLEVAQHHPEAIADTMRKRAEG